MQTKRKEFIKNLLALVLAVTTLLGTTLGVFASVADDIVLTEQSDDDSTTINTTRKGLDEIKELANAISYETYLLRYENVDFGKDTIEIDVLNYSTEDSGFKIQDYNGTNALYTPGSGKVSFEFTLSQRGKYNVEIEYYPIASKSTNAERVLRINDSVPYSEARYVSVPKYWVNNYQKAVVELGKKDNASEIVNKALSIGLVAETYSGKNSKGKTVNFLSCEYPEIWTSEISEFVEEYGLRFFSHDIDGNENRPTSTSAPNVIWQTAKLSDSSTKYSEPFVFVFESGKNTISLEGQNEPLVIKTIRLVPIEENQSYNDYIAKYASKPEGTDYIKIEAEYTHSFSSSSLYPLEDRSSAANSPVSSNKTALNVIGGEKWETAGQNAEYSFMVEKAGLYNIYTRFKQNTSDGLFVSRSLSINVLMTEETYKKIYGNLDGYCKGTYMTREEFVKAYGSDDGFYDGVPFEEAKSLQFKYDSDWQAQKLTDGTTEFKFYFRDGIEYSLNFSVSLGAMAEYIKEISSILDEINADYLAIVKLTGTEPDENIDYGFMRVMPEVITNLAKKGYEIQDISNQIAAVTGTKGSQTAILNKVADTIIRMSKDPERQIAKNLEAMKTEIGNLGTWLNDATLQPLFLDFITIQGESQKAPKGKAGFFASLWYEIKSFFASFTRDYDRVGLVEEIEEDNSVLVWLALGRDQSQIMRDIINNDFTPNTTDSNGTNIGVNLRLVTESTLLPSILAKSGPDVYIGLAQSNVINYAIRGALIGVDDMEGFDEVAINPETRHFSEAAMAVLGFEGKYYGLPLKMNFPMMFVREDILGEYNLEIPETWEELTSIGIELSGNNMQIGLPNEYQIFLYQYGGNLYADNGMRVNLDSNVALKAFNDMCNMFTENRYPYSYSFANRFRTGEMPIGIADYVSTYNQLKVFATEIEGKWSMYTIPGTDTGEVDAKGNKIINHSSVANVTADVIVAGCKSNERAWEFLKWHTGATAQSQFAEKMVSLLGDSGKQATANLEALESLTWTTAEYAEIANQIKYLASIPNYPGSYIISRYTNFAFLAAYNNKKDPVTELRSYITTINKEFTRKRKEFGLEVLEIDDEMIESLALKRRLQILQLLDKGSVVAQDPIVDGNNITYIDVTYSLSSSALSKYEQDIKEIIKAVREDEAGNERLNSELLEDLYEVKPLIENMAKDTSLSTEDQKTMQKLLSFINDSIDSYETYKLYE